MKNYFQDWFTVNESANRELAEVIKDFHSENQKLHSIFSHILIAHEIWLKRILLKTHNLHPWDHLPKEEWHLKNTSNFDLTNTLLSSEKWDRLISYQNSKGSNFQNTVADILYHILSHSAYHRGQLAFLIRQDGKTPPLTDYISYKR